MVQEPIWVTPPGNIGDVLEGQPFLFQLDFTNPLVGTINVDIISGELPPGLTITAAGLIQGTVGNLKLETEFPFTVRLTNVAGVSDRGFIILIKDNAPIWADPNNLGSFVHESEFEYQFFIADPGGCVQTFLKIGGELPPGLILSDTGLLKGFISEFTVDTVFEFTLRSFLDGNKFIDKIFEITIVLIGNRAPVWATPTGEIAQLVNTEPFSLQFIAGDADNDALSYASSGIPSGFTLTPLGFFNGALITSLETIFTFSVIATDGFANSSRIFSINANNLVVFPITWITPIGDLGSIKEGDKSLFAVRAETDDVVLRYELTGGALPTGLTLDVSTGDILGIVNEQLIVDTDFNFTIRAFNVVEETFRDFSITILENYAPNATRVYTTLWGEDRVTNWYDLFSTLDVPNEEIFRESDNQYGWIESPKILLAENLDAPAADDIFNTLKDVRRTYLILGRVEVVSAIENNEVVYEVLYRRIFDDSVDASEEFIHPQSNNILKPGSLSNIRSRLLTLGSSGGNDNLPLWMQVTDWFPAIPFVHVIPGAGQNIADIINAKASEGELLFNRRIRIDRVTMEPFEGTNPGSFPSTIILYDDIY